MSNDLGPWLGRCPRKASWKEKVKRKQDSQTVTEHLITLWNTLCLIFDRCLTDSFEIQEEIHIILIGDSSKEVKSVVFQGRPARHFFHWQNKTSRGILLQCWPPYTCVCCYSASCCSGNEWVQSPASSAALKRNWTRPTRTQRWLLPETTQRTRQSNQYSI